MYNCHMCQKEQGQYEQSNGEYLCLKCHTTLYGSLANKIRGWKELNKDLTLILPHKIDAIWVEIDDKKPNCECGASAVKSNRHSNYCPLKEQKS